MYKNPICGRKKSKKKITKEEEKGDSKINEVKPDDRHRYQQIDRGPLLRSNKQVEL